MGTLLKKEKSGAFRRVVMTYAPHETMPLHRDERSRISVVLAGSVRESTHRHDVYAETTSVVIKPGDLPHHNTFGPQGAIIASFVWPETMDLDEARRLHDTWAWHQQGAITQAALRLMTAASWQIPGMADNLFLDFFGCLGKEDATAHSQPAPPSWLGRAIEMLNDTLDQPYSVRALAKEAGVHPVHFSRTFRRCMGQTVAEYVRHRRVQAIASDLLHTSRQASLLALDAGFADGAHATRSFKKELGMTPSQYRCFFSASG